MIDMVCGLEPQWSNSPAMIFSDPKAAMAFINEQLAARDLDFQPLRQRIDHGGADAVSFPVEGFDGGSVSMLTVRIG